MFSGKKIMVVVAHPDDELLGLGATMNKLIKNHDVTTHVVILGEGITSRSGTRDTQLWEKELKKHQENIREAQKYIGYHSVNTYQFPDNRFDSVALLDIIKVVEKEKEDFNPDIIFTHNGSDLNIDHRLTFEAVITATRPMENERVKSIITFETPSATEWQASTNPRPFVPNMYVEVNEDNVEAKLSAMKQYEFEIRDFPHPRSVEALRIKMKAGGIEAGCNYAEAFHIVRLIKKI